MYLRFDCWLFKYVAVGNKKLVFIFIGNIGKEKSVRFLNEDKHHKSTRQNSILKKSTIKPLQVNLVGFCLNFYKSVKNVFFNLISIIRLAPVFNHLFTHFNSDGRVVREILKLVFTTSLLDP